MRNTRFLLLSSLVAASVSVGCTDPPANTTPDAGMTADASTLANEQCTEMVDLFCDAADTCGWNEKVSCRETYAAQCSRNQTIYSPSALSECEFQLQHWTCADNELWITFANPGVADSCTSMMLSWPKN